MNKSIVFDLDDTICFPNHKENDTEIKYANAKPNLVVINKMKDLHELGYHIVIHSARRMLTHKGNEKKILDDVGDVTIKWLAKYQVPCDELIFGKPYSSTYYVDDKAMTIKQFLTKDF